MRVINHLGNEYKGSIGKAVTASKWKGRNYFKQYFKPSNPNTVQQQKTRTWFKEAVAQWQEFLAVDKGAYRWYERYRKKMISAYNAMIGSYIAIKKAGDPYLIPPGEAVNVESTEPPETAVEGAKVIVKKAGQTTVYYLEYTDAEGYTQSSVTVEDAPYDLFITAVGFEDYSIPNIDASVVCTTHTLINETPP